MLHEIGDFRLVEPIPIDILRVRNTDLFDERRQTCEVVAVGADGVFRKSTLAGKMLQERCDIAVHTWNRRKTRVCKRMLIVQHGLELDSVDTCVITRASRLSLPSVAETFAKLPSFSRGLLRTTIRGRALQRTEDPIRTVRASASKAERVV